MKAFAQVKQSIEPIKAVLHDQYHVKSIGVFGSVARGDFGKTSDVDILVEFEQPVGLLFVKLASYLEGVLHERVDLVSRRALKERHWNEIKDEVKYV